MTRQTWMLMLAVLLSACATTAPLPGGQIVCVPPGMPPFAEWQYVAARIGPVLNDAGETVRVAEAMWTVRGQRVQAWMTSDGVLIAVDPAPENPSTPFWIDLGLMSPGTASVVLKANGKSSCQWAQQKSYASGSGERDIAPDQGGGLQRI